MNQKNAIPKLMTLKWLSKETAFIITFYEPLLQMLSGQFKNPGRLLLDFLSRYPDFHFDLNKKESIGLGGCLEYLTGDTERVFRYKIPKLVVFTDEVCSDCEGTKINKMSNYKCYNCRETGKKVIDDENASANFRQFGLSIYLFSKFMHYLAVEYYDPSKKFYKASSILDQQTMMFEISEKTGVCVAFMGAWLHNKIVDKVNEFSEEEIKAVQKAMLDVEMTLFQRKDNGMYSFRLSGNSEGKFWLQVPGSACTLGIEDQLGNMWDWGKILSPHNIDHRTAQISFLAGLTVMNEIAINK